MSTKSKKINKKTVNYFIINGASNLYIKQQVSANFKPYNKTKQRTITSIIPTFNNDHKFYTASFIIPSTHSQNTIDQEQNHQKRAEQALIQIQDIMIPKPRSKHKYCGVCRGHYQEYKEHIQGTQHLNFLNKSIYQKMIVDVCQKIQKQTNNKDQKQQQIKGQEFNSDEYVLKTSSCCSETTPTKGIQS